MKWSESISFREPLQGARLLCLDRLPEVVEMLRHRAGVAHQAGVIAGERRLSEQLVRQRTELVELQNGVFKAIRDAIPQVLEHAEKQVVELTFAIAQKIVGDLPISAPMVEAAVRDALEQAKDAGEIRIRLHPEDHALLARHSPDFLAPGTDGRRLGFETDDAVERGGCLVETRSGVIDARRETRWESVRKALTP